MKQVEETTFNQRVGKKIKHRRIQLGYTQKNVGNYLNVTLQQVQKYEKGTNGTSGFKIKQLAEMFKVNVLYFFEDRPDYTIVTHEEISQDKNLNLSPKHWKEKKKEQDILVLTKEMEVK
jgi:transcriptional regulator with XRE-family HTH domain